MQMVNTNVLKEEIQLKKRNRATAVRRLVNPQRDQLLTPLSCRGAMCMHEYRSICLFVGLSTL